MRTPRDSHNRGLSASPKGNFLPSKSIDWAKNSMSHNPSGVAYFGKSKTPPTIKGRLNITHFKCVRSSGHQSPCGAPLTFSQLTKFLQLWKGCLPREKFSRRKSSLKVMLHTRFLASCSCTFSMILCSPMQSSNRLPSEKFSCRE